MNIYISVGLMLCFIIFLFLAYFLKSKPFAIFAFALCLIILYETVNTGIEYPVGTNTTINQINGSLTRIDTDDTYQRLNTAWNNSIITIMAVLAFYLLIIIITSE
jgi:hypothetical protein